MKVLILNGSPRVKGNTKILLSFIEEAIDRDVHQVTRYDLGRLKLTPCIACNNCKDHEAKCIYNDDVGEVLEKMVESDVIIFGSPVYWWGISAQLKIILDRMYSVQEKMKNKLIGLVVVGAAELDDPEYNLIKEQFKCIANYLDWKVLFTEAVSAFAPGDVLKEPKFLSRFRKIGEKI